MGNLKDRKTDIVIRLIHVNTNAKICYEAAAEIKRLRKKFSNKYVLTNWLAAGAIGFIMGVQL